MEGILLNKINSFLKGYISTESSRAGFKKRLLSMWSVHRPRLCRSLWCSNADLLGTAMPSDTPSSIPSRAAQSSGSNRTLVSTVKNLPDVSQQLSAINRPFRTPASVASVDCLFLNSGWKSWKIKGQMVCEAANNQFSNSFEMKGQLENRLKLPAYNCDCLWIAKYENNRI